MYEDGDEDVLVGTFGTASYFHWYEDGKEEVLVGTFGTFIVTFIGPFIGTFIGTFIVTHQGNYSGGDSGARVYEDGYEESGNNKEKLRCKRWNVRNVLRQPAHFVLRMQKKLQTDDVEV